MPPIHPDPEQVAVKIPVRRAEWLALVHIEIPPDDEVSRVSRCDLVLEDIW